MIVLRVSCDNFLFSSAIVQASSVYPYQTFNCTQYSDCESCAHDASCGWCDGVCKPLSSSLTCNSLAVERGSCFACSSIADCATCASTTEATCVWATSNCIDPRSVSFYQSPVVSNATLCPLPCLERPTCNACFASDIYNSENNCAWSQTTLSCYDWSQFEAVYWEGSLINYDTYPAECPDCTQYTQCSSCLNAFQCGWCSAMV